MAAVPLTLTAQARAKATAAAGTFLWSGRTWTRRLDGTGQGPGPNNWKAANVSLVSANVLRLAITQVAGLWYCGELDGLQSLGYGRYRFVINSDLSAVDPHVVLGLFTYDNTTVSPFREIDIEVNSVGDQFNSAFTVQPAAEAQVERFSFNSNPPYTCDWIWQAGQVYFVVADASGTVLHQHVVNDGVQVPGNEVVILNAWLVGGNAPAAPLNLDIASFAFTPGVTFTPPLTSSRSISFDRPPADFYLHGGASISGTKLSVPCAATYPAYAEGEHIYSLIGSSLSIQVTALPAVGTGTTEARFYAYHDANNFLLADKSGNTILVRKCEAGVNTDNYLPFTSAMPFWRWDELGGNVRFSTSPDNVVWTTAYTIPHTMSAKLANVRVRLGAGYYGTEVSPGPFQIAAINQVQEVVPSQDPLAVFSAPPSLDPPALLDDVPPFERSSRQVQAVLGVVANELARIDAGRQALIQNFYPLSADVLLPLFEQLLGLPVSPPATLDARRQLVATYMGRLKSEGRGLDWIALISQTVGTGNWNHAEHDPANVTSPPGYQVNVNIPQASAGYAWPLIRDLTPAHLYVFQGYTGGFIVGSTPIWPGGPGNNL